MFVFGYDYSLSGNMKQLSLLEQARLRFPERNDPEHVTQLVGDTLRELAEEPPIDLQVVASYRSIQAIRYEDMEFSGSLTPEPSGLIMRLRRSEPWARQRFSGFHEVGHTFLPGYADKPVFRCHPRAPKTQREPVYSTEVLADVAASEFLLPTDFVVADLKTADFGLTTVEALASRYDAGIHASANRLVQLWPEPALLIVLAQSTKPRDPDGAQPRLRVQAHWAEPATLWPWIPRWKSASDDGPLARAFAGEIVREPASLAELGLPNPALLEISARSFSYRANGELHQRVFALYRQLLRPPTPQRGLHA